MLARHPHLKLTCLWWERAARMTGVASNYYDNRYWTM